MSSQYEYKQLIRKYGEEQGIQMDGTYYKLSLLKESLLTILEVGTHYYVLYELQDRYIGEHQHLVQEIYVTEVDINLLQEFLLGEQPLSAILSINSTSYRQGSVNHSIYTGIKVRGLNDIRNYLPRKDVWVQDFVVNKPELHNLLHSIWTNLNTGNEVV